MSFSEEYDHQDLESNHPLDGEPLSDDDCLYEPILAIEIFNRYCLKVKEEAMVSTKTMESIRQVTISLMKAQTSQCHRQVYNVLENYRVDPSSMPELEDAFMAGQWMHDSPELNDGNFMKTNSRIDTKGNLVREEKTVEKTCKSKK